MRFRGASDLRILIAVCMARIIVDMLSQTPPRPSYGRVDL